MSVEQSESFRWALRAPRVINGTINEFSIKFLRDRYLPQNIIDNVFPISKVTKPFISLVMYGSEALQAMVTTTLITGKLSAGIGVGFTYLGLQGVTSYRERMINALVSNHREIKG
jgi:hypothetical protein